MCLDKDLPVLAERLRLGLPLRGFDGRAIPLRNDLGESLCPTEAGDLLLRSGASLLPADQADAFVAAALERVERIRCMATEAGDAPAIVAAKVTGVLVSAAVRASVLARGVDISPTAINQATLSWYDLSRLRRRELMLASGTYEDTRQSA